MGRWPSGVQCGILGAGVTSDLSWCPSQTLWPLIDRAHIDWIWCWLAGNILNYIILWLICWKWKHFLLLDTFIKLGKCGMIVMELQNKLYFAQLKVKGLNHKYSGLSPSTECSSFHPQSKEDKKLKIKKRKFSECSGILFWQGPNKARQSNDLFSLPNRHMAPVRCAEW